MNVVVRSANERVSVPFVCGANDDVPSPLANESIALQSASDVARDFRLASTAAARL